MERLRLRKIVQTSFNKSEMTNFDETYFKSAANRKLIDELGKDDCICLLSVGQDNLIFVKGYVAAYERNSGRSWMVLGSRRVRIRRGKGLSDQFEPLMLANYAKTVGIELIGLPLFEEYLKHLT